MADRFGMDLGTINSAVCFYNDGRKAYEFLKIGNQTRDFFPTVIAYEKGSSGNRYIGEQAQKFRFSKKYDVYDLFKLSLGENAHRKNGREKSPYEVTRDFLGEVIREFSEHNGCTQLNNLVVTIPEVWKNEDRNKIAVDNLMQIFEELGLEEDRTALESEPVSAVAYYCRQVCEGPYNGHVIVIDYGGGTLDLTLCSVEGGKNITVLRRCGDGGSDAMGCAGVAFDTALTKRLVEKNGLSGYDEGTNRFAKLRIAVENAKISSTEQTRKALKAYYAAYDPYTRESFDDNAAFLVVVPSADEDDEEFEVMASDVAEVFDQVNAPALKEALETIKGYCAQLNLDYHSQETMRILMVGGFSNLYCVEAICRDVFASLVSASDRRFDEKMRQEGRPSIAISHGAGIIAAGAAKIDYTCQCDVGFVYYDSGDYFDTEKERMVFQRVIRRNTPVRDYKNPVYDDAWYTLLYGTEEVQLSLFFDDGSGVVPVTMKESFRELLGDMLHKGNTYQIGFSMGRHQIPMLHVRDRQGRENSVSLHKVISRVALRRVSEKQEETV